MTHPTNPHTRESETLLPCPFCGEPAGDIDFYGDFDHDEKVRVSRGRFVSCTGCSVSIWRRRDTKELEDAAIIEAWNRRISTPQPLTPSDERGLLSRVRDYNEGRGQFNFRSLPDDQRENAAFDAWQVIRAEIDAALSKPITPSDEMVDEACEAFWAYGGGLWIKGRAKEPHADSDIIKNFLCMRAALTAALNLMGGDK